MQRSWLVVRNIEMEDLGIFAEVFEARGESFTYCDAYANAALPDPTAAAGVVVLGGPMNVYEEARYPFLALEDAFLKVALRAGVPTLGICLGAQLIAKASGARVRRGPAKEIGWLPIEQTPEASSDPLFAGLPSSLQVFHWHGDTFDLPAGARHLARSALCAHQAYALGRCVYGLQFHFEVTPAMIESWLQATVNAGDVAEIGGAARAAAIRQETERFAEPLRQHGRRFFSRFLELAAG